jgi:anti-sigma factor RsiW
MTDDRFPPFGPDDRPQELAHPERDSSSAADDERSSGDGADSIHPVVEELSAFLDHALTVGETTALADHLDECLACSRELERLDTARGFLSSAGRPSAPPGAAESAIAAALASETSSPTEVARIAEISKQRTIRRQRQVQIVARAAVTVLVAGAIGGGLYKVIRSSHGGSSSAGSATPFRAGPVPGGSTTTPSWSNSKSMKPPPPGALALQLRADTGQTRCSEVGRLGEVAVDGKLVVVNPAASKPAVVRLPVAAGQPKMCIGVGPAFATAWSADISQVTIEPALGSSTPATTTSAARKVDVVVALASNAVTDSVTLDEALHRRLTVEVIAQGVDLGTAVVTRGPVVTLAVGQSVATFLRDQLRSGTGSSG